MSIIYVLLPVAVLLALGAIALFLWAVRDGQFDDLETPSMKLLLDDENYAQQENSDSAESIEEEAPAESVGPQGSSKP